MLVEVIPTSATFPVLRVLQREVSNTWPSAITPKSIADVTLVHTITGSVLLGLLTESRFRKRVRSRTKICRAGVQRAPLGQVAFSFQAAKAAPNPAALSSSLVRHSQWPKSTSLRVVSTLSEQDAERATTLANSSCFRSAPLHNTHRQGKRRSILPTIRACKRPN